MIIIICLTPIQRVHLIDVHLTGVVSMHLSHRRASHRHASHRRHRRAWLACISHRLSLSCASPGRQRRGYLLKFLVFRLE
jgi:hypothetical protein